MTEKWGCPDWRDADAYPAAPEDLEDWQWQWEFMRRSPDYRELWERRDDPEVAETWFWGGENYRKYQLERQIDPRTTPKALPFRNYPGGSFRLPVTRAELTHFHVSRIRELNLSAEEAVHELITALYMHGLTADPENSRWDFIMFDLTKPHAYQLEIAAQQLKHHAKEEGINPGRSPQLFGATRELWPRHLRVIDAVDQGAKPPDVFLQFADEGLVQESAKSQPYALFNQWNEQAVEVMEKVIAFL